MREYLGQVRVGRASLQDDPTARQRLMEESAYMVAAQRWRHQAEEMTHHNVAGWNTQHMKLKKWMWNWYQALKERLDNEIPTLEEEEKLAQRRKPTDGDAIGPFLRLLSTEKMATMTISELLRYGTSDGGVRTARTAITLGRVVEQEYNAEVALAQRSRGPDPVVLTSEGSLTELAAIRQQARDSEDFTMAIPPDWTQVIRGRVGGFLLNAVIDVATITRRGIRPSTGEEVSEEQPAFAHCYEFLHGRKIGLIKFNPELTEQLSSEPIKDALHPRQLPMLIPPRPWIDVERGAYMYSRTSVMRYKDSLEQSSFLRSASSAGHLESMYAALDVLGSTPWTINRPIFDVVIAVWNSGKQFAKIPPAGLEGEDPVKPDNYETDPKAKRDFVRAMSTSIQKRHENHSMRCDTNYKLEIARAFLGERFYFPHNVDFRGRAYPVPPNLNHMGDDLCRGLLTFADKKALGERGLRWLKIHAANKFGYDKASFEERVTWTMEHLDEIYDSAKKPLDGQRWWLKADDPWQFLASCIELHNALESPNPAEFESSLPVHQDGTCNGLQHYAALGGDGQGARQVNLDVGDRPADVYTFVANMVEKRLDEAAAKGDEKAKWLQGRIARKVVKQTVMTTVYGVTFVGARDQIRKQIEALPGVSISEQESYAMAVYVARLTLSCIGDLFGGAKSIQLWLNKVCALITKSIPPERIDLLLRDKEYAGEVRNAPMKRTYTSLVKEQMTSMIWTTPLGMPVVQPYRKQAKKQIYTSLQSLFIADPNLPMEVSSRKQASAFPPNFIHSLDATHMMLTALGCRDKQLTFASVHDSYWTHAASIDEMSATIRDTFVKLHSADILGNLLLEIQQRYKDYKVPVSLLTTMHLTRPKPTMAEAEEEGAEEDADDSPGNCVALNVARISKEDLARMTSSEEIDLDIGKSGASSDEADAEAEVEENGTSKKRKYATRKLKPLKTRFVNLIDIIPPVPSKGEFDIQKIKDSLYFFS
ncbi:DNA/RNA polymerase [Dacryopinax primogenitus]|uniref:DNA-directed RNA polymerase n=1 Tax=Dacryopinax primogenitus (strain DJM 731) TaxID=1858805 RepID=M5FVA2_DACPD|nr:DNA/RNA polymerase [Dacryopinax primogenitus]EJU00189.1 DNA/RNA polymerase [Dacryopinax primogenitus]